VRLAAGAGRLLAALRLLSAGSTDRAPGARRLQARQRLRERREEKRREASAAAAPDPALLRAREAAASAAEAELLREEAEEVRLASRVFTLSIIVCACRLHVH